MNISSLEDFGWRCLGVVSHDMGWGGGGVGEGPLTDVSLPAGNLAWTVAEWVFLYL